jgi:hypothetical protein
VVMPAVFAVVLGVFAVGLLAGFSAMRGWL